MDWFFDVLLHKIWLLNEKLERISSMGRRVLVTGSQLRVLARRGRNRNVMPEDSENNTTANYQVEAVKRRHSGTFADEQRQRALYRNMKIGHMIDLEDDPSSMSDQSASDDGNLYGNGTTGTKASLNGEFVSVANLTNNATGSFDNGSNHEKVYGGNRTNANETSYDGDVFGSASSLASLN